MGNPLSLFACRKGVDMKRKEYEKSIDRHVRISDTKLIEQFDKLLTHPSYKSFNKVLNDALFYGLPIVIEKVFGAKQEPEKPKQNEAIEARKESEYYGEIAKLLQEVILNENINKSILSSLFNVQALIADKGTVTGRKFVDGEYGDTPEYLENYEYNGLKKIRRQKK